MTTYKVELANKIRKGRAVGNLYGIGKYEDGCRGGWAMEPQEDEQKAWEKAAYLNRQTELARTAFYASAGRPKFWDANPANYPFPVTIAVDERYGRFGGQYTAFYRTFFSRRAPGRAVEAIYDAFS